jgi:hypothetical protein
VIYIHGCIGSTMVAVSCGLIAMDSAAPPARPAADGGTITSTVQTFRHSSKIKLPALSHLKKPQLS